MQTRALVFLTLFVCAAAHQHHVDTVQYIGDAMGSAGVIKQSQPGWTYNGASVDVMADAMAEASDEGVVPYSIMFIPGYNYVTFNLDAMTSHVGVISVTFAGTTGDILLLDAAGVELVQLNFPGENLASIDIQFDLSGAQDLSWFNFSSTSDVFLNPLVKVYNVDEMNEDGTYVFDLAMGNSTFLSAHDYGSAPMMFKLSENLPVYDVSDIVSEMSVPVLVLNVVGGSCCAQSNSKSVNFGVAQSDNTDLFSMDSYANQALSAMLNIPVVLTGTLVESSGLQLNSQTDVFFGRYGRIIDAKGWDEYSSATYTGQVTVNGTMYSSDGQQAGGAYGNDFFTTCPDGNTKSLLNNYNTVDDSLLFWCPTSAADAFASFAVHESIHTFTHPWVHINLLINVIDNGSVELKLWWLVDTTDAVTSAADFTAMNSHNFANITLADSGDIGERQLSNDFYVPAYDLLDGATHIAITASLDGFKNFVFHPLIQFYDAPKATPSSSATVAASVSASPSSAATPSPTATPSSSDAQDQDDDDDAGQVVIRAPYTLTFGNGTVSPDDLTNTMNSNAIEEAICGLASLSAARCNLVSAMTANSKQTRIEAIVDITADTQAEADSVRTALNGATATEVVDAINTALTSAGSSLQITEAQVGDITTSTSAAPAFATFFSALVALFACAVLH